MYIYASCMCCYLMIFGSIWDSVNQSRDMLMAFLDAHCAEENDKNEVGDEISSYDFLYLPIDFK